MTDVIIRPARREDAGTIAALYRISSDGVADYIWSRLAEPGEALRGGDQAGGQPQRQGAQDMGETGHGISVRRRRP